MFTLWTRNHLYFCIAPVFILQGSTENNRFYILQKDMFVSFSDVFKTIFYVLQLIIGQCKKNPFIDGAFIFNGHLGVKGSLMEYC